MFTPMKTRDVAAAMFSGFPSFAWKRGAKADDLVVAAGDEILSVPRHFGEPYLSAVAGNRRTGNQLLH
jgi:hypothetical protein